MMLNIGDSAATASGTSEGAWETCKTLYGNVSRICNPSGMQLVLPSRRDSGEHFPYRFGQHRCLIRKIALCCFEIRDGGIEVGEWLHDMADLDLQCVVPMVKEHNFGHHVLGRLK